MRRGWLVAKSVVRTLKPVIYFQTKKNQNIVISGLRSQERELLTGQLAYMHLSECVIWFVCVGAYTYCIHLFKCVSTHIVGKALEFTFQLSKHTRTQSAAGRQTEKWLYEPLCTHAYILKGCSILVFLGVMKHMG